MHLLGDGGLGGTRVSVRNARGLYHSRLSVPSENTSTHTHTHTHLLGDGVCAGVDGVVPALVDDEELGPRDSEATDWSQHRGPGTNHHPISMGTK